MVWEKEYIDDLGTTFFRYSLNGERAMHFKTDDFGLTAELYKMGCMLSDEEQGCEKSIRLILHHFTMNAWSKSLARFSGREKTPKVNSPEYKLIESIEGVMKCAAGEETWREPEIFSGELCDYDYGNYEGFLHSILFDSELIAKKIGEIPIIEEEGCPTLDDLFPDSEFTNFNIYALNYTTPRDFLRQYRKLYHELEDLILINSVHES